MGPKGIKNAVSKRRPKQNIISLILSNAKKHQGGGSGSTTASSRSEEKANQPSGSGGGSRSGGGEGNKRGGSGSRSRRKSASRNLIQSAVELTRRSKNITSKSTSKSTSGKTSKGGKMMHRGKLGNKKVPFIKGQRAFYRSNKGISKVTVVGIHHDAKLEPYYTIKLRDGKEKQTDGKHLTPVQEREKKESGGIKKGSGNSSKDGSNKAAGREGDKTGSSSHGDSAAAGKLAPSREEPSAVASSMNTHEGMTDQMSTSSSDEEIEVEDVTSEGEETDGDDDDDEIVIDYTSEKDGEEEEEEENEKIAELAKSVPHRPRDHNAGSRRASMPTRRSSSGSGGNTSHLSNSLNAGKRRPSEDSVGENNTNKKAFTEGQEVYWRNPSGGITKVTIALIGKHDRYTIYLPDDSEVKDVRGARLSTLMDLTSKELSMLMKERNKRQPERKHASSTGSGSGSHYSTGEGRHHHSSSHRRSHASSRASRQVEEEEEEEHHEAAIAEENAVDEGYEAEVGEPISSSSEQSEELAVAHEDQGEISNNDNGNSNNHSQDTAETTNSSSTPKNEESEPTTSTALVVPPSMQMVTAMTESGEPKEVPLYEAGMEVLYKNASGVQGCKILAVHLDDLLEPYYDVKLEDGKEKQTDNAHIMLALENGNNGDGDGKGVGGDGTKDEEETQQEGGQMEEEKSLTISEPSIPEADKSAPPKKHHHHNKADGERSHEAPSTAKKPQGADPAAALSSEAAAIVIPATFCIGDEVLYSSSQGDQARAKVVKLQRDKKNRPYYVIKLHHGKEKQVYGHRLKPLAKEEDGKENGLRRSRSRSRSSRGALASSTRSSSRRNKDPPYKRSESMDSRKSDVSKKSTSSRRSRASRERSVGREPSVASSRDSSVGVRSSSSRGRQHRSSIRDESMTRQQHRDESTPSSARKTRSHSKQPPSTSAQTKPRRVSRSIDPSGHRGRERPGKERRSRSRAPSEDSRATAASATPNKLKVRGFSRSRQNKGPVGVSMTSKGSSSGDNNHHHSISNHHSIPTTPGTVGDDQSRVSGKSISKLRNFRKNFVSMKKKS